MSFERRFFGILALALGIICVGCTPPSDPLIDMMDADLKKTRIDDLSRTMDFISSEIRFSQKEFKDKIATGLNRWVSYSDDKLANVEWKMDSLS